MTAPDPFVVARLYKYLRVADVCDALDGLGHFDLHLMSPEVRPLWPGMRFWGPAFTIRCVPANRPMWPLKTTEEILAAHGLWFKQVPHIRTIDRYKPGHVVVTDTGGAREVGFWGSGNSLNAMTRGVVGIVTDGYCRDTAEVALQRTPICARARGRSIIPGRIEVAEVEVKVGCGGVQVRPGDIVGCDDDGVIVVPVELAQDVAIHARAVLLADMRGRRELYDELKMPHDASVDVESVEAYYRDVEAVPGSA
jgi:4-hydroxy-4-methyl-2-oxoglutarate aldolase